MVEAGRLAGRDEAGDTQACKFSRRSNIPHQSEVSPSEDCYALSSDVSGSIDFANGGSATFLTAERIEW
jgi:hypothetical protein